MIVDAISAILDGNNATTFATGNHRNGLATVAPQGKQKRIQFIIICFDPLNDIFITYLRSH